MAYLVEVVVIVSLLLAILLGRNHHLHSLLLCLMGDGIAVITTINKKKLSLYSFNHIRSFCAVSRDARSNKDSDRHTMRIDKLNVFWEPWSRELAQQRDNLTLEEFGWLLDEYRLSLFSPGVPVKDKVSEKRLMEAWESRG